MSIDFLPALRPEHPAWNKGRIIGQKRPLLPKHVWSIRVRLEMADNRRDLALFNMAIDSKLRGCDLVKIMMSSTDRNQNPSDRHSAEDRSACPIRDQ